MPFGAILTDLAPAILPPYLNIRQEVTPKQRGYGFVCQNLKKKKKKNL